MADRKGATMVEFEVTESREIGGVHRVVGEIVTMMPAQAKYYVSPYGTGLKPVTPKIASKSGSGKPANKAKA